MLPFHIIEFLGSYTKERYYLIEKDRCERMIGNKVTEFVPLPEKIKGIIFDRKIIFRKI